MGRNDDGHESRTSGITTTRATTIAPAHNNYIFNNITYYWTSADSNGALRAAAWADGGSNDICPVGFSVPTEAELAADTISATTTTIINKDTAFSSFLKIPVAGYPKYGIMYLTLLTPIYSSGLGLLVDLSVVI
ncbi:hypothetical protein BSPWISOXPB_918 [uncultured Gammaproteobacteria bacterium]|nr:hypothetical protein BSPWISOXPB_918 [uncultured Gammaproteobacteria bacterium]